MTSGVAQLAQARPKRPRALGPGGIRTIVVIVPVLLLELACRRGWISPTVVIPPSAMLVSVGDILADPEQWRNIAISFGNVAITSVVSVVFGFLIGAVLHALPAARRSLEPLLASYYAIPTFMFYPVFIILFGVGSAAIVAIAVMLSIVAMITATLNGLDRIPEVLRKTARVFRMSPMERVFRIDLPAAIPYLFTGVKLAIAYAFIGVIASEFILSGAGVGYAIAYAYNNFNNTTMYGLMLLIVLTVTIINAVLDRIDQRLQARTRR